MIDEVVQVDSRVITMTLDRIIETRAWTTITHIASGTSVRIGYLPGDVKGDGVCDETDVTAHVDTLNGLLPAKPIWSMDIDWSSTITGADTLELVDLLNGADAYESYLGATLP